MLHNQCSVRVVGGQEKDNGYVHMQHGQEYSLRLHNYKTARCDTTVSIDGQVVGSWRINPRDSICIERSAFIDRKFTFYKLGSAEGGKAQLKDNDELGLITVEFKHEKLVLRQPNLVQRDDGYESYGISRGKNLYSNPSRGAKRSFGAGGASAGGTGLGAHSDQSFGSIARIADYESESVVINLRLVAAENEPDILPLSAVNATPIPPRV